MATVLPGSASAALSPEHASDLLQSVECPFCHASTPYGLEGDGNCVQIPCGTCGNNLILLPQNDDQAVDKPLAPPSSEPAEPAISSEIPFAQRRLGILVAFLAGLLNYLMLASLAGAVFTQAQQTHDPYDVDEALLSPFILRSNGWTSLHLAAARGDLDTASALLAEGVEIDALNNRGRTPLYEASKRGQAEVVALLLQHGADPNIRGVQGFTPLLAAAEFGHAPVIGLLAAKGANVSALCDCGDSALHRAVHHGNLQAAQVLLDLGINVNRKSHGQTALELAEEREDQELIELLRRYGGREFKAAKAHLTRGLTLQKKGLYDAALLAYAEALALDPDYSDAYFNRGMALMGKGSHDEAVIAFRTVMELDPYRIDAYGHTAWIHGQRKQWDQGLALWDRYLALQPTDGRGYYERSFFKRAGGNPKGFMDDLQRACTLGYHKAC